MARFRGTIQGCRGEASRLGSKGSGLDVRANGWNIGARVDLRVNDQGEDEISIEITGGSNNSSTLWDLGNFTRKAIERKIQRQRRKAS